MADAAQLEERFPAFFAKVGTTAADALAADELDWSGKGLAPSDGEALAAFVAAHAAAANVIAAQPSASNASAVPHLKTLRRASRSLSIRL